MDWFRELFRHHRRYDEVSEQIREHLEEKIADLMDSGMTRTEAEHTARREFGNVSLIEERSREVWQWPTVESAVADIRFALRQLIKSPGFTVTSLLTLALGIGVNVAVFSVVDAVLLKPLPYKNADRLVMIAELAPKEQIPAFDTYREYEEWNRDSKSFEKLAGATWARNAGAILSWHGEKKEIMVVPATVDFFTMLGVEAAQGRTFETQDLKSQCTIVLYAMRFWERLGSKLGSLPGVQGFAFAPSFSFAQGKGQVTVESAATSARVVSASDPQSVSSGYFRIAGIPLLEGREFSDGDRPESMLVAIVNQAFAKQHLAKGAGVGQRVKLGKADSKEPWLTIVGIAGNISRPTLFEGYSEDPSVYRPLRQAPQASLAVLVRTIGNPRAVESEVGHAVVAVDNNIPIPTVQTVNESLDWFTSEPRFRAQLFGVFSLLALLLAFVGIYGVLSQRVAQRTQEIGIRVALGAQQGGLLMLIMGEGIRLTLIGIAIGIASSLILRSLSRKYALRNKSDRPVYALGRIAAPGICGFACVLHSRTTSDGDEPGGCPPLRITCGPLWRA